jgi:hypothetical protein
MSGSFCMVPGLCVCGPGSHIKDLVLIPEGQEPRRGLQMASTIGEGTEADTACSDSTASPGLHGTETRTMCQIPMCTPHLPGSLWLSGTGWADMTPLKGGCIPLIFFSSVPVVIKRMIPNDTTTKCWQSRFLSHHLEEGRNLAELSH